LRLIERWKRYREVRRLRAAVRASPSPRSFGALAERYVAHDRLRDALAVAEKGLHRFPDSERLQQVRSFALRKSLSGRIRRLRAEIERRPTPFAYTRLAEIHRELGDDDEALDLATTCTQQFPLNAQPLLVEGEIRVERFLRDVVAQDGILAATALRRVLTLNGASVKAHVLLAELYHLVGAVADCRRHLHVVLAERGEEHDVRAFVASLGDGAWDADLEELTPDAFETLARAVEESGEFVGDPATFPAIVQHGPASRRIRALAIDLDGLSRDVARAGRSLGMRNTVLLDRDGRVLAEHCDDGGMAREDFAHVVRQLRSTADDTSRRMDAGALVRTELEGPAGDLTVMRVQRLTVGALYSEPLRAARVWELLQDLTARNLSPRPEVAHA
jgi:hypothetical protein